MSIEAMKQALEALGAYMSATDSEEDEKAHSLMATAFFKLKEAIAKAEKQEPVAWAQFSEIGNLIDLLEEPCKGYAPLYTHPQPKREWVGLTDDEINEGLLRFDYALQTAHAWRAGVVFAMTKLKDKNT